MDLEELILEAAASPTDKNLKALLPVLAEKPISQAAAEQFETLWAELNCKNCTGAIAGFAIEAANQGAPDTSALRKVLGSAIKQQLPPYLNQLPIVKAIGVKNDKFTSQEIAARFKRLMALKHGTIVFLPASRRWGMAGTIDALNASVPLMPFGPVGSNSRIPLEIVLNDVVVLNNGSDVTRLVTAASIPISAMLFRSIIDKRKITDVSPETAKLMAQCGCARKLVGPLFEKYWGVGNDTAAPAAAPAVSGKRRACDSRSLQEMNLLLTAESQNSPAPFQGDEPAALLAFFERLRPDAANRDAKLLADNLALLTGRMDAATGKKILELLKGKNILFPENPEQSDNASLQVWGELSNKTLENLAGPAAAAFDQVYLISLALRLPSKALNSFGVFLDDEELNRQVSSNRVNNADLLLWIWKNKKRFADSRLLTLVNLDNVVRILNIQDPDKNAVAARRELLALFRCDPHADKKMEFQKHLFKMLNNDAATYCTMLTGLLFLTASERQNLLLKVSEISPDIKSSIEKGAAARILSGAKASGEIQQSGIQEPLYASMLSKFNMEKELNKIITVDLPENQIAYAAAKALGDFRENSDFDAAKERKRQLENRRRELERTLREIRLLAFENVLVSDTVVLGSRVKTRNTADQIDSEVCILGAYDGNPDRNLLSYQAPLAKALMGHKKGDRVVWQKHELLITEIGKLPENLIKELDQQK